MIRTAPYLLAAASLLGACNRGKVETRPEAKPTPASQDTVPGGAAAPAPSVNTFAYPDGMANHPGLSGFRESLLRAIRKGDENAILNSFSEIIEFDPAHSKGKDGVKEIWGLDGSKEKLAGLSTLLEALLNEGGCIRVESEVDSTFTAPYWNCVPPEQAGDCEESGCGVIGREGAIALDSPTQGAEPAFELSPLQVIPSSMDTLCNAEFTSCGWTRVSTADGKTGFVPKGKLNTERDGMIWLVKESGQWKIRVLRSPQIPFDDT